MRGTGFLINVANLLGLPLGAKRAKVSNPISKGVQEKPFYEETRLKDFLNSIIDITKDDICIGEVPLFYKTTKKRIGKELRDKIDNLTEELNKIIDGAAVGILKKGYAVYTYKIYKEDNKENIYFHPLLGEVALFLDYKNEVRVYDEEGTRLENVLVFAFYEESSLVKSEDEDTERGAYRITPVGLQVKNSQQAIEDLSNTELAIQRLRNQMRYVRFASVEVGLNKGDNQQEVVDDVSEGLNANSEDLYTTGMYDDSIPVFPTRKGIGAPTLSEYAPTADMGALTDLDYNLSKVFLSLRFPKTYADFSQNLSQTAVSMIRGDIRYNKLLTRGRTILETAINRWVSQVGILKEIGFKVFLTTIPSPEEDDVTESLASFTDFTVEVTDYVTESENKEEAEAKLEALSALYSNATNLKSVEKWLNAMRRVIREHFQTIGEDLDDDFDEDLDPIGSSPAAPKTKTASPETEAPEEDDSEDLQIQV